MGIMYLKVAVISRRMYDKGERGTGCAGGEGREKERHTGPEKGGRRRATAEAATLNGATADPGPGNAAATRTREGAGALPPAPGLRDRMPGPGSAGTALNATTGLRKDPRQREH